MRLRRPLPLLALLLGHLAHAEGSAAEGRAIIAQARQLANQGQADAAEELLQQAHRVMPDSAEPLLLRGNLLAFLRRQPEQAIELYHEALAINVTFETKYFLGKAYAALERWAAAAEAFEGAIELAPNSQAALTDLSMARIRNGDWSGGKEALLVAASLDRHSPVPLAKLAQFARQLSTLDESIEAYRNLTELHPWHPQYMVELATLLASQDNEDDLSTSWQSADLRGSPSLTDVVDAAQALDRRVAIPRAVLSKCKQRTLAPVDKRATDAAAAFGRGACSMLRAFPNLALYAHETADGCEVVIPSGVTVSLQSQAPRGMLVPEGFKLRVVGSQGSVIDANGMSRHFMVAAGAVLELDGISLIGGRSLLSSGGSVLLLPGSAMVANGVQFLGNRAVFGSGGAIAARGASLTCRRCIWRDNEATYRGGAISASSLAKSEGETVVLASADFEDNHAARGAADVQVSENVRIDGLHDERLDVRTGQSIDDSITEGETGFALFALECVLEALELQEGPELSQPALAMLQQASLADPSSPTVFSTYATFLYSHGLDTQASNVLSAFKHLRPTEALVPQFEVTLANKSVNALQLRGQTLNKQVAALRRGQTSACPYGDKMTAQDATVTALVQAILLDPSNGELWHDLGTSLFFAGEKSESELVYAKGLTYAPQHTQLIKEAEHERLYPPVKGIQQKVVHSFTDDAFERVTLPPGSFSLKTESDITAGAEVFGNSPNVFVSREPLLTKEQCSNAIAEAEAWASRRNGWTTSRHYTVPTTDVPLIELPSVLKWFNVALSEKLLPALASRYPEAAPEVSKLRVLDCFLVKYSAAAQNKLPTHADQSLLSFTISLNDPSEYEGGGTWFEQLGRAIDAPGAGHVIMFPGKVEHGGNPITGGTRYVIVLFMGYSANRSGRPTGYITQRTNELAAEMKSSTSQTSKDEL